MHVNVKDQNGYRMAIEATRSPGGVIGIAAHKIEGSSASAPLRAFTRRQVAEAADKAKTSESKPRSSSGFMGMQVQNHHAISVYAVDGTVTHNRLFANLGDFGRISLHFHLRHTRVLHGGCRHRHERLGVFRGRVRFRGEDDYVNVDAREFHGKVETQGRRTRRCVRIAVAVPPAASRNAQSGAKPDSGHHKVHRISLLSAKRLSNSGATFFSAFKETREYTDLLSVNFQMRGPVAVDRFAYAEGRAGDFKTSKGLKTARIKPTPKALHGAGHFRARKKANHWKGSLATSFPGAPHVRLAGPNFEAKLRSVGF